MASSSRFFHSLLLGVLAAGLAACSQANLPSASAVGPGAVQAAGKSSRTAAGDELALLKLDPTLRPLKFSASRSRALLPSQVDLRPKMSPVDDQGPYIKSCTGFAMVAVAEYLARQKGDTTELSPSFIYKLELVEDGNYGRDAGSYIETGMKVLQKYGVAPEALEPYLVLAAQDDLKVFDYLHKMPSAAVMQAALAHRLSGFKAVDDLDGVRTALAQGKPVPFLMSVYPGFRTPEVWKTGRIPVPDTAKERAVGLHALVAVGYDDAQQVLFVRQSRGAGWGDKGYGTMPYAYFRDGLVYDAWQTN